MPGARYTMLKPSRSVTEARKHLLASRAHDMRRFPQGPELLLWQELRGGRLGVSFRRQAVIGNRYIADFVAPSLGLVVEVDGGTHAHRRVADARRDRDLERLGYRVLRIPARVVMGDLGGAVALVCAAVDPLRR